MKEEKEFPSNLGHWADFLRVTQLALVGGLATQRRAGLDRTRTGRWHGRLQLKARYGGRTQCDSWPRWGSGGGGRHQHSGSSVDEALRAQWQELCHTEGVLWDLLNWERKH
jgi:hypothetical protein